MATTLLESLQNKMKNQSKPEQASPGQTQAVQRLQRAASGKAVGSRGPAVSSLGEKMARTQADQAIGQIQQKGQLQEQQQLQQQADQTQAAEQQRAGIQQSREQAKQAAAQQMAELEQNLEQGRDKADFQEYAAYLEQMGFLARLSNDQYITQLQQQGKLNRLDNELSFKEALVEESLDFASDELIKSLDFKRAVDMDNDEFLRYLGTISIEQAMQVAQATANQQNIKGMYEGGQQIISAGFKAYDKYESQGMSNNQAMRIYENPSEYSIEQVREAEKVLARE